MDLKEYIKKTLSEIIIGVSEAKDETYSAFNNCIIAPGTVDGVKVSGQRDYIEFEIQTVIEGGGKLKVLSLGEVGLGGEHTHKLKFSVPILYEALKPMQKKD